MSESKDSDEGPRSPHLEVNEDKMFESRLRGDYGLHDRAHTPTNQEGKKVHSIGGATSIHASSRGIASGIDVHFSYTLLTFSRYL